MPGRRRNRVEERAAIAAAVVAGAAAVFAPPSPTGQVQVDGALLAVGAFAVTFAAASAPWWLVVLAPAVALAVAVDPVLVGAGALALAAGVAVTIRRRSMWLWRATAVGIAINVLARAEFDGFFGLTSLIAIATGVLILVVGLHRRPRQVRRRAWLVAGTVVVLGLLTLVGFAAGAFGARRSVEIAQQRIEEGIRLLDDGDFTAAAGEFRSATTALRDAEDRLTNPLVAGARLLPVIAQHRSFAVELSEKGSELTGQIADALGQVDMAALVQPGGRIDVTRLAALEQPFAAIETALDEFDAVIASSTESEWILDEIRTELGGLSARIDANRPQLEDVGTAVRLLPDLLGASGPRRYVVLFTTPSEARGLGGFPGNWAELTIDAGQVTMSDFGRIHELELAATAAQARLTGMNGFHSRYDEFGFDVDGRGLVSTASLRNLTMTPQFPWVAEAVTQLYPQMTGREIDGVLVMDPYVIAALLQYTGPIELSSVQFTLTADNAVEYLLRDQYEGTDDPGENVERIDALEEAGRLTFEALLAGTLPDPVDLARDLGSLVAERRLLVWTTNDPEQDFLRDLGLLGELPVARGANGWGLTVNNRSPSKIDSYLERRASYTWRVGANGEVTGTLRVTLTNTAPSSGLPRTVIGNAHGLPLGTSRLYVSFYSTMLLTGATRDGEPAFVSAEHEVGWNVYSQYVVIPPDGTVSYELTFEGTPADPTNVVTWTQPLATPLLPL